MTASITVAEFVRRREAVLKALKGAVGLVLAGEGSAQLHGTWQPDSHFLYLTGIDTEPGAALLLDPQAENPKRRAILFLKPRDPDMEVWDGYRDPINAALRERLGFQTVMRVASLPNLLARAARVRKRLACLHKFATHESAVSPDLAIFRKVSERTLGVALEDQTMLIPALRAIKSPAEIRLMEAAADATAEGFARAVRTIRPGVNEREIHTALEQGFTAGGGTGLAYNPIVGSGLNSTVLHYNRNNATVHPHDLIVIDAGASFHGYACDVTRTYPASGKFESDQRDVYEVVLKAQEAAIRAVRPGVQIFRVDEAAREVIDKAGLLDYYPHGIGHHLGLLVHDADPDAPLAQGMVVTIEPGVYIPDKKLGVRIEDDILVTSKPGGRNLTSMIPKSVRAIEAALKKR
jgi:Xaa-Pro aminopeptidase